MNQQQGFLAHADGTIAGLKSQQATIEYRKTICPADQVELLTRDTDRLQREIDRLGIIRKDITSKLSAEEIKDYEASRVKPKTELEKRAEIEEMNRRMNENKDRPGI
jgi:hypothetical protein